MGARAVGPWVGEQKPLGKTPLGGSPSPEMTYLPTFSTVVLRTIRVDAASRPTVMDQVLACSNCRASGKVKIVRRCSMKTISAAQ